MSHQSSRFDVDDVLDCMRTDVPTGSAAAKRRVSMRLAGSMAALAKRPESGENDASQGETDSPATGDDVNLDGNPSPSNLTDLSVSSGPSSLLSAPTSKAAQWLGPMMARPVVWSLAMFSVGAACGAGIEAAIMRHRAAPDVSVTARANAALEARAPEKGVASVDSRANSARDGQGPGKVEAVELAMPEATPLQATSAPAPAGRARGHNASLAAQQALLDEARTALARGDDGAALRAVEQHVRRYPDSVMIEEREALAIKALVGKGNYAEARVRGERFRARFPRSLLMSSIDETLGAIP